MVVLTNKYFDGGVVPTPNAFSDVDEATLNAVKAYPADDWKIAIERYRFRGGGQVLNS